MRKNKLLIFICPILLLTSFAFFSNSCTSDYFVDETNYLVYVPEVADRSANSCQIYIYDMNGNLAGNRTAVAPYDNIYRIEDGIFSFMLQPGEYQVFVYLNTGGVNIVETSTLATARMQLPNGVTDDKGLIADDMKQYAFGQVPVILYDKYNTTIENSLMHEDTADVKTYPGRITVLFKNMPLNVASISNSRLFAYGVGNSQHFDRPTSEKGSESDFMFSYQAAEAPASGFDYQIDNIFFSSVTDDLMTFNMQFYDAQQNIVGTIDVELRDPNTQEPLVLNTGERLVIEVDKYLIHNVSIVGWDDDIDSGGGIVVE